MCRVRSSKPEDTHRSSKCGAHYFERAQSVRTATPFAVRYRFYLGWMIFVDSNDLLKGK